MRIVIATASLVCILLSGGSFVAERFSNAYLRAQPEIESRLRPRTSDLKILNRQIELPMIDAGPFLSLAKVSVALAERGATPARVRARRCEAIRTLQRGVKRDPISGTALVNLAYLVSRDSRARCARDLNSADLTREALAVAPTNPEVLHTAAFVLRDLGFREEALAAGNRALALGVPLPSESPTGLFGLIDQPDQLTTLLPRTLPVVVEWSEMISKLDRAEWEAFRSPLAVVQQETLQKSGLETRMPLAFRELTLLRRLSKAVGSDEVRRKIDTLLAVALDEPLLRMRRDLVRLRTVSAGIQADSTPKRGALMEWQRETPLVVDYFFNSIGLFVNDASRVVRLELLSDYPVSRATVGLLKIFSSLDNRMWKDVTSEVTVESAWTGHQGIVGFSVPPGKHGPFWKVHFASSLRDGQLAGRPEDLLVAYGRGNAPGVMAGSQASLLGKEIPQ